MEHTTILGLNCSHDAAAAIAVDGTIISAIAEERLTRRKHAAGFPERSIDYCLKEAGLRRASARIDQVVINQLPPGVGASYERRAVDHFAPGAVGNVIVNPSHHFLHACYAEMLSSHRPIVILVVDGSGYSYLEHKRRGSPFLGPPPASEDMCESLTAYYIDENGATTILMKEWGEWREFNTLRFPSLGHMYGLAAEHVFGSWIHAGKLMGLAPFGEPEALRDKRVVTINNDGVEIHTDWLVNVPKIEFSEHLESIPLARNLAAKAQAELERAMMHLCTLLKTMTHSEAICLTGGVALNSVFNGLLARDGPFKKVFVVPASSDAGTAIGAAAFGSRLMGKSLKFRNHVEFLGRSYNADEVLQTLKKSRSVRDAAVDDPVECVA